MRNLHHPNIVRFVAYEENEDHTQAYLWIEYCNGGDLSYYILKDFGNGTINSPLKVLSRKEVWHIFSEIAAAVAYLHLGVIKEDNLFCLKTD